LLENVALRMSNLQVIKNRCNRVRTSLGRVLVALIRNGMGIFVTYYLWSFMTYMYSLRITYGVY